MTRAPQPDSLVLAVLAVIPLIAMTLTGCAAPVDSVRNVVVDADVRDCSPDIFNSLGSLDVAIVIDTSQSTRRPTGFDIDRDGSIHRFHRNSAIDRGDSRLAAQVAAVRLMLRNAEGRDIRFAIVTFSGSNTARTAGRTQLTGSVRDSRVRARLTNDTQKLDFVLADVLDAGSDGKTIFFAGMQRAIRTLIESDHRTRRKVVLFMSDSGMPNSLDVDGNFEELDPRMKNAAIIARIHEVVFNTFGLSPESGQWRKRSLGQIAGATGGTYHPIEDPENLYCHLVSSLLRPHQRDQRRWRGAFASYRERRAASSKASTRSGEVAPE